MKEAISSLQNPRIKQVAALQKGNRRRKEGVFLLEGERETMLALKAGCRFETFFYCPAAGGEESLQRLEGLLKEQRVPIWEVTEQVFAKIAYRETTGGVLSVVKAQYPELSELALRPNPLILVLEGVEKPGNLGAMLRTADAAAADAVLVCDPTTDPYNPNVIRSSVGCVFTVPVVGCTSAQAIEWLKAKGISLLAAALTATRRYDQTDMTGPVAIAMGTEATGLSEQWLRQADQGIIIPMLGSIDSLNVANSAAILLFEAMRQRDFQVGRQRH